MKLEVLQDAEAVAQRAAVFVAEEARAACRERGGFSFAVSGGTTPWAMLRALREEEVPWQGVHVFQVDERVAPAGDPERNLTQLRESLRGMPVGDGRLHAMDVEEADLEEAAVCYAREIEAVAGAPPVFDLVHLGLGADGHTASLFPGDPMLEIGDADVAVTARAHQGRRRMTLTYPVLARARRILWIVTGSSKREMLARLLEGDGTIPAGRVRRERSVVMADRAAAGGS